MLHVDGPSSEEADTTAPPGPINHTDAMLSEFCHKISEKPSPFMSLVPTIFQLEAAINPAVDVTPPLEFINQTVAVLSVFCHSISEKPSPFMSLVPAIFHVEATTLNPLWMSLPRLNS